MKIIANPRAGRGAGIATIERLETRIRERGLDWEIVRTEHPDHATEIARTLVASGTSRIGVLGGDGSAGETAQSLVGTDTALALFPTGTGNDLARSLGIPRNDIDAAIDVALGGTVRSIDIGRERDRHFVTVMGLVFPSLVAEMANELTWLKGSFAFFAAVYRALHRLRAVPLTIEIDGRREQRECVAILVQNTPFTGGGLLMAPAAEIDDGRLDVVIVDRIGKLELMFHFPRAYRGRHLDHPAFEVHRARTIAIHAAEPLAKMFDGDLCGTTPVDVTVLPRALKVIV